MEPETTDHPKGVEAGVHHVDQVASVDAESPRISSPPPQYDAETEARVRHKLDRHLMPLLFTLYLFAFIDRSNIGNAEVAGMQQDLALTGNRYPLLLIMFYVAYAAFGFLLLLWKAYPPHIVVACMIFGWGVLATAQAAVQSWGAMMAVRFLLGVFEAGMAPGGIWYLNFFYLRREVGFRCGLFSSAGPLASTFSGALAYGITSGHAAMPGWRLLFLVEGLATIAVVPIIFLLLPDGPEKARFLTPEEKQVVAARAIRQIGHRDRVAGRLNLRDAARALKDPVPWLLAATYFSCNVSFSSLPLFLPTILVNMGYSPINAQGLSAPPYFLAFLGAMLTTWAGDKTQQRGLILFATTCVGGTGYVVLATVQSQAVRYFATYLAAVGVFPAIPQVLAWTLSTQQSDERRGAGLILLDLIGFCAPMLGTQIFPADQAPRYIEGMSICAGFSFLAALLALVLRALLWWRNRKLDEKYGKQVAEKNTVGVEDYGPGFRYVL